MDTESVERHHSRWGGRKFGVTEMYDTSVVQLSDRLRLVQIRKKFHISQSHRPAGEIGLCET